jgi:class 3 adenylate cyclase
MQSFASGRVGIIIVLLGIILATKAPAVGSTDYRHGELVIKKGQVKIPEWRLHDVIPLKGHWEIYWDQLLGPISIDKFYENRQFVRVPSTWNQIVGLEPTGVATYRLQIDFDEAHEDLALYVPEILSAWKLWVDGEAVAEVGEVASDYELQVASRESMVVPLKSKGKTIEIVLQVANFHYAKGGLFAPLVLGKRRLVNQWVDDQNGLVNLFIGGLAVMAIYHFMIFSIRPTTKSTLYFGIVCVLIAIRTMQVEDTYMAFPLLKKAFSLSYKLEYLGFAATIGVYALFCREMFGRGFSKWLVVYSSLIGFGYSLLVVFSSDLVYSGFLIYFQGLALLSIVLAFANVGYCVYKGSYGSVLFLVGMSIFLVTCVVDIVASIVGIELNVSTLGLYVFIYSQAFLIARKLNRSVTLLEDEKKKTEHAYGQLKKVVYPHQLMQVREGRSIEATMPTGKGEACVISFDVIGSSKIQHERVKEFFDEVFRRCGDVMMDDYDSKRMVGKAYRIKQMGDGFLCSVGFPFKPPVEKKVAHTALQISLEFFRVFNEEVAKLQYRFPIHCAAGLAFGEVEGYFTEAGIVNYDLHGRGVILATRYESFRKYLQEDQKLNGNILILQEKVYLSLSPVLTKSFHEIELTRSSYKVRDDPSASKLYYLVNPEDVFSLDPISTDDHHDAA